MYMLTAVQYVDLIRVFLNLCSCKDATCGTLLTLFRQTHSPGQERIPLNWYRRPTTNQYNLVEVVADLVISNAAYPGILRIGGNTGTTDSFTGVDLQDLTGGVFNSETLLDGNSGACFLYQATLAAMPRYVLCFRKCV